jgi:hypothetical protein
MAYCGSVILSPIISLYGRRSTSKPATCQAKRVASSTASASQRRGFEQAVITELDNVMVAQTTQHPSHVMAELVFVAASTRNAIPSIAPSLTCTETEETVSK